MPLGGGLGRNGLGKFEQRILFAVRELQDGGYAVSVAASIERRFGGPVSLGAAYATLARLERKGLISSVLGEPTPVRGGRQKRFYRATENGLRALADAIQADARMQA
jgi:DNA-binding PadR family transcriptional regulator